jgi:CDP-diacylglycerol---glycerol-3-phosphate 3-phosphatidyltransferase
MNSSYYLKPAFQQGLRPLCAALVLHGVRANHITIVALLLSGIQGLIIALWPQETWPLVLLPLVLFIRMALNAMDGILAREFGMKTPLGVILNELGDVISDVVLYLPLALVPGMAAPLIVGLTILAIITEMSGTIATQIGSQRNYAGPMGKSDRALVIGAMALLMGLGLTPGIWTDVILYAVIILLLYTIINRIQQARGVIPV